MQFNVHLFPTVRIKIEGVEAASPLEAALKAEEMADIESILSCKDNGLVVGRLGLGRVTHIGWDQGVIKTAIVDTCNETGEVISEDGVCIDLETENEAVNGKTQAERRLHKIAALSTQTAQASVGYENLLNDMRLFLEALPRDLGRGSLNGMKVQLLHKVCEAIASTTHTEPASQAGVSGGKFFYYSPDVGFNTVDTLEEAKKLANAEIDEYRDQADQEWPAEVDEVCIGYVIAETVEVETVPGGCDYVLEAIASTTHAEPTYVLFGYATGEFLDRIVPPARGKLLNDAVALYCKADFSQMNQPSPAAEEAKPRQQDAKMPEPYGWIVNGRLFKELPEGCKSGETKAFCLPYYTADQLTAHTQEAIRELVEGIQEWVSATPGYSATLRNLITKYAPKKEQ